jgi:hypothetical protein
MVEEVTLKVEIACDNEVFAQCASIFNLPPNGNIIDKATVSFFNSPANISKTASLNTHVNLRRANKSRYASVCRIKFFLTFNCF